MTTAQTISASPADDATGDATSDDYLTAGQCDRALRDAARRVSRTLAVLPLPERRHVADREWMRVYRQYTLIDGQIAPLLISGDDLAAIGMGQVRDVLFARLTLLGAAVRA